MSRIRLVKSFGWCTVGVLMGHKRKMKRKEQKQNTYKNHRLTKAINRITQIILYKLIQRQTKNVVLNILEKTSCFRNGWLIISTLFQMSIPSSSRIRSDVFWLVLDGTAALTDASLDPVGVTFVWFIRSSELANEWFNEEMAWLLVSVLTH